MLKDYIEAISESLGHECSVLYSSHPLSCTFPSLPIAAMPEKHIPNSKSHTNLQVLYIYIRLYKYIVIVYHNPKLDQVNYTYTYNIYQLIRPTHGEVRRICSSPREPRSVTAPRRQASVSHADLNLVRWRVDKYMIY